MLAAVNTSSEHILGYSIGAPRRKSEHYILGYRRDVSEP